jgi:hypothetical protein
MFTGVLDLPRYEQVVKVHTTEGRGFTPEEVAQRCADKIISVSDTADPVLKQQAYAYKENIAKLVEQYFKEAVRSDRTTVYNALMDAGHPKLADAIRRL